MSIVVQKLVVRLKRTHGVLIMKLYHQDGKAQSFRLNDNYQKTKYPEVRTLPLPTNMKELPNSERMVFSKERDRDILGTYLAAVSSSSYAKENNGNQDESDLRIGKYDYSGPVDLSSSMQTNVPQPFGGNRGLTNLNMPRGQWGQEAKYISEQLHRYHYLNTRYPTSLIQSKCYFSSEKKSLENDESGKSGEGQSSGGGEQLTKVDKLKAAIKEYGTTILVLHISLSLVSLGVCYGLIQSGINLEEIIKEQGWSDGAGVVSSAGPFIVAYAVHKVLAPFRIGLTLAVTPFVVRFLRKRGFTVKGK